MCGRLNWDRVEAVSLLYLPKVGEEGLAIHRSFVSLPRGGGWQLLPPVPDFMRRHRLQTAWFQAWGPQGWEWCHGLVELNDNGVAIVTQIG